MIMRTHLAIGAAVCLFFLPHISSALLFVPTILIASVIPDVDTAFSNVGKHAVFRPLQMVFRHRTLFHSFTLALVLSVIIAFYFPVVALPFFLGYSFHLLADSFTVDGVQLFWPLGKTSAGKIRTGGRIEDGIFISFLLVDGLLLLMLFI